MSIVIRQGSVLDGKDYGTINKAKKASRQSSDKVVVKRHKVQQHYPLVRAMIPPHNNPNHHYVLKALELKAKGKKHLTYRLW